IEAGMQAFPHVNLDIMYALPRQTIEQCRADITEATSYGTDHLSLYHLTLEPNTVFAKYPPALPTDESAAAMHELVASTAQRAGFDQYEVSAFARGNNRAIHNVNYWEF